MANLSMTHAATQKRIRSHYRHSTLTHPRTVLSDRSLLRPRTASQRSRRRKFEGLENSSKFKLEVRLAPVGPCIDCYCLGKINPLNSLNISSLAPLSPCPRPFGGRMERQLVVVRKDGTDGPAIELEDALDYHIGRRKT